MKLSALLVCEGYERHPPNLFTLYKSGIHRIALNTNKPLEMFVFACLMKGNEDSETLFECRIRIGLASNPDEYEEVPGSFAFHPKGIMGFVFLPFVMKAVGDFTITFSVDGTDVSGTWPMMVLGLDQVRRRF